MLRRGFLSSLAGAAVAQSQQRLLKPKALQKGDVVGLISPATFVSNPESLMLAERALRHFGLEPRMGGNVRKKEGYTGGSIADRLADLHDMFRDPAIKAVFCLRGGFGSAHLLDSIDYGLIAKNPKIFLGYSDITAMHLAIHRKTGLVTFHGPVALSRFSSFTQENFRKAIFDPKPMGSLTNPPDSDPIRPSHLLRTVRPGTARGPLVGGNLTLLSTTLGTPYEVDSRGKIFFIEDVDEQPYSIDRMLTHLRLAGKLDAAAGIVWGECADCRPKDYKPSFTEGNFSLPEVVDRILGNLKVPVLSGLTIGHTDDQLTLPLGITASLDATKGTLTIEESATV
ncbi:MAG: LD-carboxypeptidase [Bryobacterales bacterium]|nr:LD-carboxypeptidase [Bryobacterales bacterium]